MLTNQDIEELKQRVKEFRLTGISERRTREQLINLALRFLGWDVSNYRRVNTEHSITGPGGAKESRVDYALFAENGNPAVFVEAKRLDGIEEASVGQIRRYAFEEITRKGTRDLASLVLTDGNVWKFYPLSHGRGIDYHPHWCHTLNLETGEDSKNEKDLNDLLDIQKVSSGKSSKYLERLFRLNRTEKACKSILARPPETLLKLIEEEMEKDNCESNSEEIKKIIQSYTGLRRLTLSDDELVALVAGKRAERGYEPEQDEVRNFIFGRTGTGTGTEIVTETETETKKKKFQVKYDGKIVGGRKQIAVMRNTLALFVDARGIEKVREECVNTGTDNPLVQTKEDLKERARLNLNVRYKKFSNYFTEPEYKDYYYFDNISATNKKEELEKLARRLGISHRVKVELTDRISAEPQRSVLDELLDFE